MKKYALAAAVALFLIAASITSREEAIPKEGFFNYTLHFCSREDCIKEITASLQAAKSQVKCAFYRVDGDLMLSIPANVPAWIVVDKGARIPAAGNVKISNASSKGIMHNKYCIIDDTTLITGSFNPVEEAKSDYNNLLIINSTALAAFYSSDFSMLKEGKTQAPAAGHARRKRAILNATLIEVYFCPQDNCIDAVRRALRKANSSILFAAYSFTHPEIANELIIKTAEGVQVTGVMEKSGSGSVHSKYAAMAVNGIGVRLESSKWLMHHKFFVVDGETVITGSFNPTKNAAERNDENVIIITSKEFAGMYVEEFDTINNRSSAQ
ncbi:TPA: DUF1669 domain-containing protein [Candidatus Woesearchaeota archaeon]|nr:DUF1669 domain-containing protein [Candidatus Woesearchaeota archaeon]